MANIRKRRSGKTGLPPGTLVHIGERKLEKTFFSAIRYNPEFIEEHEYNQLEDIPLASADSILWANITGVHDHVQVEAAGRKFGIHPLILEDIMNTEQRPKTEDYGDFVFFVFKMLSNSSKGELQSEQVSILLGKNLVITFQESPGDVFEPIRVRLRSGKGKIRSLKSDYLVYTLIDAIVDNFFLVMEVAGEEMEELEEQVLERPDKKVVTRVHELKRQLLHVRRAAWPLRELISTFEKSDSPLLQASTRIFLRDVYDHSMQIMDNIEVSREIISGLLEVYLSSLSNRTNEVMKVLTVTASIFIPLTFIAGVYGMNFEYMPELRWPWGYPAIMLFMVALAAAMLWVFKRKKWL